MAEDGGARAKSATVQSNPRRVTSIGRINVRVIKGIIAKEQVDVIVNTANKELDLSKGRASKALIDEAGDSLQTECDECYGNGIDFGEIAVTDPGDLDCQKVFHGALPKWEGQHQEKVLRQLVMGCLNEGDSRHFGSIAIPALGTGYLAYPKDKSAKIIFDCLEDFESAKSSTSLTDVKIVVFTADKDTFQAFIAEARQRSLAQQKKRLKSAPARPPTRTSSIANIGNIQIKVIVGSMAHMKVDIIVNSTTPTLKLDSRPGLSKSLLQTAGQSMQDDCDNCYPSGIEPGEIAVTNGYGLNCKKVYHGTLPGWYSKRYGTLLPEKVMHNFVCECLEEAEKYQCTSIAFPALGSGFLKYPIDTAATKMIQAIGRFQQSRKTNHIKNIYIVIFSGTPNWKDIEKEFIDQLQGQKQPVKTNIPQAPSGKIPPRGTKEFFKYKYQEELHTPPYWTQYHSGRSIKDWNTQNKGSPFKIVDVDQKTYNDVVAIFNATFGVGSGHVIKVQRVESIQLFEKYQQECQRLFRKLVVEGGIRAIDKTKGSSGPVVTTQQMDKALTKHLYPEINEHYFFHGTKVNRVDVIFSQGLDCRLAQNGRVGVGVYGAERSVKSAQYVDQNSNGESKLFLIRMCLGDVYTCQQQTLFKRPPCKKCGSQVCTSHVDYYDSVMADGGQFTDREFVVYDRNQSYPEYLITYK